MHTNTAHTHTPLYWWELIKIAPEYVGVFAVWSEHHHHVRRSSERMDVRMVIGLFLIYANARACIQMCVCGRTVYVVG